METSITPENSESQPITALSETPQTPVLPNADPSTSAYADPGTVIVIPRVFLNYVVIAIAFFALGAVISGTAVSGLFNANSAENKRLIDAAVSAGGLVDSAGQQTAGLQQGQAVTVSLDDDPSWGPADAPVTIVEFSDFQCPFCGRFHEETYAQLKQTYGDKIRFVYRDFPIVQLHPNAEMSAQATQCANEQGKYWDYHDLLLSNQTLSTRADLGNFARQAELDVTAFNQCLDSGRFKDEVAKDLQDGAGYGVQGTPTFFVNGKALIGAQPYSVFAQMIDAELARAANSAASSTS